MLRIIASLTALSICLTGCGSGIGVVHGTVFYKGRKLSQGTVTLTNGAGFLQVVDIQPDGTYRFDNVPTGKLKIGVESQNPADIKQRVDEAKRAAAEGLPMRGNVTGTVRMGDSTSWFEIPTTYAVPEDSGLTVDVSSGDNEFDIKLE